MGLISEIGEVCGLIKKAIRGDYDIHDKTLDLLHELGDICWYADRSMSIRNTTMSEVFMESTSIEEVQVYILKQVMPQEETIPSMCCALSLASSQAIGHGNETWFFNRRIRDVLINVILIAHHFGYSLTDVLMANVEKLSSRKNKGTIQGNGDNR